MAATRNAPRVVWTCVTEDRPDWHERVVRLAVSIRTFGGALRDAPIVVRVVDGVSPTLRRRLSRLDVHAISVDPWDPRRRHLNKLRMLEPTDVDHDVLVALDCDVVVTGDLGPHVDPTAIRAKPVDTDPLGTHQWARLYAAMGLRVPARPFVASSTGRPVLPYVNSGVLAIPRHLASPLLAGWSEAASRLVAAFEHDPALVPPHRRFYLDQYALACAVQHLDLPLRPLGVECNWPLHVPVHRRLRRTLGAPVVVHYHGHVDRDGFLTRSPVAPELDEVLDRANHALAEHLGRPYRGIRGRSVPQRVRRRAERGWLWARDVRSRAADLVRSTGAAGADQDGHRARTV